MPIGRMLALPERGAFGTREFTKYSIGKEPFVYLPEHACNQTELDHCTEHSGITQAEIVGEGRDGRRGLAWLGAGI